MTLELSGADEGVCRWRTGLRGDVVAEVEVGALFPNRKANRHGRSTSGNWWFCRVSQSASIIGLCEGNDLHNRDWAERVLLVRVPDALRA